MRIYISADMEGTAGVATWTQCDPNNASEYPIYRRFMTQEVRAAVEAARLCGATSFLVNDSHSSMRNLLWDELPPDIRMIAGSRKPYSMAQGADAKFDAAFFTGYHAPIGAQNGVLAHTYAPNSIYNVFVNGIHCSEATLNAGILGYYGTPVVLITGDRATIEHATQQMPWITGVIVKESFGHYAVETTSPAAAQSAIAAGAREALQQLAHAKPFVFDSPAMLEIETTGSEHADYMEMIPGFERTGGRRVRFTHSDYRIIFKAFVTAFRLGYVADEKV
ncbi:MAG: peptidase M55 [Candidatus Meridianibacter frigidus]|nr:MAG: peptidase M55 [Candidatus Eremiobacteraeota bacterium]